MSDPDYAARRKRLKRLGAHFGDGYKPDEVPAQPKRYLVHVMDHGWHAESWDELADDAAELEAILSQDEQTVVRIVDLDTGAEVPFERTVSVNVSLP